MNGQRIWDTRILVNGTVFPETPVTRFRIEASRFERCDAAEIHLAVDRNILGDKRPWFDPEQDVRLDIQLQMRQQGVDDQAWQKLFHGVVGHVVWHPDEASVVLECRDYLSFLLDLRVQQSWLNQTPEEILTSLIEAVGLTPDIAFVRDGDAQSGMTGQFWQIEHKRLAAFAQHRFQTAFDLGFFLAREAGCDLYASGKRIVCHPVIRKNDENTVIHEADENFITRIFRRNLAATENIVVHVASWDSRQRSRSEIFYDGVDFSSTAPSDTGTIHSFRVPGRRMDDIKAVARGKYARIAAHRLDVSMTMPGRVGIQPRQFLRLRDERHSWSGALSIDAVISSCSVEAGFLQDFVLRDRSLGLE